MGTRLDAKDQPILLAAIDVEAGQLLSDERRRWA